MVGGRVQALQVVQRDRRVDEEAEDASTEHVPEGHGDEEHQRPAHRFHPDGLVLHRPVLEGVIAQQHQRHHFQGGEHRADGRDGGGGTREVQVVERARDTADHEQHGGEQAGRGGRVLADHAQVVEHEADRAGSEHFEEAFHPQVHHPPAPVLHDGDVRVLTVDQCRGIEDADGSSSHGEQDQQALVARSAQGQVDAAHHQHQPEDQADEERQLPDAAKLDVLIALVAEPPVQVRGHPALQRHELATEGTDHHDDQCPEEHVHTQLLVLGILAAVDDGDEEQASSQEARGDPEDGRLDVPGAGQRVRQVLGERNAVEVLTFNRVVGGGATQQHLHQEEGSHDQQILAERLLRGGELDQRQRVGLGSLDLDVLLVGEEGPDPDDEADTEDQRHDRGDRPDHVLGRGFVADQRLMRPVVGVGDIQPRTVGGRSPGRPEEEGSHLRAQLGIRQRVLLHGVGGTQLLEGRVVAEQLVVVGRNALDGADAVFRQRDLVGGLVEGVGAERNLRVVAQRGLVALGQLLEVLAKLALGLLVQPVQHFAVQPVSCPVRSLVGAVPPDRTDRHAADGLPGGLACVDVFLGVDGLAVLAHECGRNRRALVIHLFTEVTEHRKRPDHDDR